MMANRKGLKVDPWCRPTSIEQGSLVPAAHLSTVFTLVIHVLHQSDVLIWDPLVYNARYEFRLYCRNRGPFSDWSHITAVMEGH